MVLASTGAVDPLVHSIAFCIIFAGVLTVIFARLKIPSIAALLLAGVLLGPNTPGVVVDLQSISTIASLGLVLLLFLIGLEMDLRKLLASGRTLLVTGLLQFPLCVAFGWGAGWLARRMGWEALAGPYTALYAGLLAAASSTLVVVRLLQERYQMDTLVARVAVGILIIQDIWSIVVLAAQPNLERPEIATVAFNFLGIAILCCIGILLSRTVVPMALRWIARSPELLLVAAGAWCFGLGILGTSLGDIADACRFHAPVSVSMEMGALIAGATLATHPMSHQVVSKVAVVHDFFITLFFVALGVGIPMPKGAAVFLLAGFLAGVAVASRYVVFLPLLYSTGMDRRNAVVASTRLIPISEFCLVIVYLGKGMGHVTDEFAGAAIFAFVGTALGAPLVFEQGQRIHSCLGGLLSAVGMKPPGSVSGEGTAAEKHSVVLLGFHRVTSSLLHELGRTHPGIVEEVLVLDINEGIHAAIRKRGADAHYADLASVETLRAAGIDEAKVAICTIPDDLLHGTSNAKLVRILRSIAPEVVIIANSITIHGVSELYEAGADYVYLRRVETAMNLVPALVAALEGDIAGYRRAQQETLGKFEERDEVLP